MNHKISLSAVTEIQKSPLSKQTPNCSDGCGTDWGDSSTHVHSPQTGVHKVTLYQCSVWWTSECSLGLLTGGWAKGPLQGVGKVGKWLHTQKIHSGTGDPWE